MDLTALKAQLKIGELDSFYIFTGPEIKVLDIYLNYIAKTFDGTIKMLDSATDLMQKLHTRSVLKSRSVYVLRDSKDFLSNDNLHSVITQKNTFTDCLVVLVYTAVDKRSKLYKKFKDNVVEFEYMKPSVLVKYVQKELDLTDSVSKDLISVCENDYSRILLEIDKIKRYMLCENVDANRAFKVLVEDGTIYSPPYDAVFDFVDAVLKYKVKLSFRLLAESYGSGEATLILLSNLYNSAKQLLQVQSYLGDAKITEATGLTPFQIKLASGRKGVYSNGDLVYLMRLVRDAEKGIKTGAIEDMMAVPYVLVNLWN